MSELKVTPIAAKLRASVLQQAVEGRLVPQDPDDEPSSVLLERIREERAELVKQKKAKAQRGGESRIHRGTDGSWYEQRGKAKPVCIDKDIPFDIPENWEWSRMSVLIELLSGVDLTPSEYNDRHNGIPYITGASNFDDGTLIENRWTVSPRRVSHEGDLLFTCKGTVGDMAINSFERAHIARQVMAVCPVDYEMLPYIEIVLSAQVERIKNAAKGLIPGIERKTILDGLVSLPPLAEQQRIVERINEIMPLIDRLEKLERESDAVDSRFWRDLPSSILQQAVEGRLVPQDPSDEPADILLDRIRKERAELVKEKKAKASKGGESRIYRSAAGSWYEQRGKADPVCIDKEIPFDVPENWTWSRLTDCSEAIVDCPHSTPKYFSEDTGYYAIDTNCMDYGWNQTGSRNLSKGEYEVRTVKLVPRPNDLVLSREASIGRAVILRDENYCLGQRVMLIRSGDNLDVKYLQLLLTSPYAWSLYRALNQGTGVKHINVSVIRNMLIPVPPLVEQRRIAAKVSEIRAMLAERFIASAV
ncbi:restriction endonuclease subunit S [Bifidobacterium dentium]|uniref:restriction endonuclease subunit S n=1 Tax=Bifidobacterium dentium TaxID=1689 RepID=UPI003D1742A9